MNGYQWLRLSIFTAVLSLAGGFASGDYVRLDASMAQPYVLAGDAQKAYLRVTLRGEELPKSANRTPVNVAIVLDKSGSMQGQKIADARVAAMKAIDRLSPDDIVSIVAYDDTVRVVLPATKASDKDKVFRAIEGIQAGGSTALFAGVSKGAAEVRKFMDKNRVNRVILLSDGLANVGPSTPGDLAELGTSLGREGIAVTTIGLGLDYNEDLMTQLAQKSDGNHMFAEHPGDLDRIFAREIGDVLSVVAQDVEIVIDCATGVRPIRVLGRDADVIGERVITSMNQLYSGQDKYIFLEVELPATEHLAERAELNIADVHCRFNETITRKTREQLAPASIRLTRSPQSVEDHTNAKIMASVIEQVGVEQNEKAVILRDEGRIEEAKQLLDQNAQMLQEAGQKYESEDLRRYSEKNKEARENIDDDADWKKQRKVMREEQYTIVQQQVTN